MLLRRYTCHRLEPVGEMRCALAYSPLLHSGCNNVSDILVEGFTLNHRILQRLIHLLREHLPHYMVIEDH